ncbi:MAG: SDR family oxidoreductase [Desulfobacterales bacterium]|nr:SDR family oxidoreductase [Desulfobacterales bacterium]
MYTDLKGKTALITGAGKRVGIGFAIARKLAACGTHVILSDLAASPSYNPDTTTGNSEEMARMAAGLAEDYHVRTLAVDLDVTDPASIAGMVETASARFDGIDVLINNAGAAIGVPAEFRNYDEAAWMKTIDINLHGVFRVSRAILPLMAGGGSIINMSSRAGKVAPLFNGAYAVAKAGVIMLTRVMALELAGQKIRANALCPGLIMTDMQAWRIGLESQFTGKPFEAQKQDLATRVPMGELGTPGQVADLAVFLASGASAYITGQAINVCGGQTMAL